jgi:hypothetical protein
MKIKIKAKKPADGFQDSRGQESAIPPSPVVQNEIISPSNTYVVPKKTAFVPAISFEAAPKIQARPITPVQPVKNPTNNFVPRDKKYVVNNGNKPYTPRNTSNQQGVGDTTKKPVVPGTQSAPAFQYDPRTSYKPKKPMTPRISFEPAPKMHVTERTNTQVGQKPVSTHV